MTRAALHNLANPISIADLAALVSEPILSRTGCDDLMIDSVAAISDARSGALTFCRASGEKGRNLVAETRASVVLVGPEISVDDPGDRCFLTVANPARWFIRAVTALFPDDGTPLIHQAAVIEDGAEIGPGCHIDAGAFIGRRVTLGANCRIGPNCSLGDAGLAVEYDEDGMPLSYPHIGRLNIGNDVIIGANTVIVRGILETTEIGDHARIGNMVNIGHNCRVGRACWISSAAVLCGSVVLEDQVMIGASATLNNHVTVGAGATVGIGSVVTKSVEAGRRVFGNPAKILSTMRALR